MVHVGHQCVTSTDQYFWPCMWELARASMIMLALLFHVPALIVCLRRIRDLDAIINIMEDIRKLNDIRGVVGELERNVRKDQERQSLLEFIKQRVDVRMELVEAFRHQMIHLKNLGATRGETLADRWSMIMSLIDMLAQTQVILRSAGSWVSLHPGKQKVIAKIVRLHCDGLIERSFRPGPQVEMEMQLFSYKLLQHRERSLFEQLDDIWDAQLEAGVELEEEAWYERVAVFSTSDQEIDIRKRPQLIETQFPVKVCYIWERVNGMGPPAVPLSESRSVSHGTADAPRLRRRSVRTARPRPPSGPRNAPEITKTNPGAEARANALGQVPVQAPAHAPVHSRQPSDTSRTSRPQGPSAMSTNDVVPRLASDKIPAQRLRPRSSQARASIDSNLAPPALHEGVARATAATTLSPSRLRSAGVSHDGAAASSTDPPGRLRSPRR